MKKSKNNDILIAKAEGYVVYYDPWYFTYYIIYADRDPKEPYPWYNNLDSVKEALYYHGVLQSKDSLLG